MQKNYKDVIWTNHALSRMRERGIKQGDAWTAFNRSEQTKKAKIKGAWVYYRTYGSEKIEVVAKKNEKRKWMIFWQSPYPSPPALNRCSRVLK